MKVGKICTRAVDGISHEASHASMLSAVLFKGQHKLCDYGVFLTGTKASGDYKSSGVGSVLQNFIASPSLL